MELDARQVAKIDPLLQELLSQAKGEEEIRAIVVLEADAVQVGRVLSPSEFPSRQAYREALLAQRREQMGEALAETLHQLRALSLKTMGDAVSPVVMVEGSAKQLLQALTLPAVRHANLDQLIGAPQIAPPEQVDDLAALYRQVFDQYFNVKKQAIDEQFKKKKQDLDEQFKKKKQDLNQKLNAKEEDLNQKLNPKEQALDPKLNAKKQALDQQLNAEKQALDQQLNAEKQALDQQLNAEKQALYQQLNTEKQVLLNAKTQDLIVRACEQYLLQYYQRYGKLQVLGMPKPVELESIFTAVQCLEKPDYSRLESEGAMQEAFRQAAKRGFQSRKTHKVDGMAIANIEQYLMVLGAPGAGKSTFLRKLGLEALKGKQGSFDDTRFPVILELKRLTDDEIDLEQLIIRELQERQLPFAKGFIKSALIQGKLLLLLDGLDEVPTKNQEHAISKIQELAERFRKNRFVISCRVAAYRKSFRGFTNVEIAEFDDDQIRQFIQNWFSLEADHQAHTAEACWTLLNQSNHDATRELARNPLLLTFLCLVYDQSQDFPSNRSTLYGIALDILLERWWSQKRVNNIEPIYRKLGIELEKAMLAKIAYESFATDSLFFSRQQLVNQIQQFLNQQAQTSDLRAEFILDSIAIQQGIWVERARNVYSFSHLTFQEYLTAQYIYDQNQVEAFVSNSLTDSRWREVFLLISGLMRGGSDMFLLQIKSNSRIYLKETKKSFFRGSKIKALFDWTDYSTLGSEANYKPATKRVLALALALALTLAFSLDLAPDHTFVFDSVHARVLDKDLVRALEHACVLARALAHALDPSLDPSLTLPLDFVLDNVRARAFTLDLSLIYAYEKIKIFKAVNFSALTRELTCLKNSVPDSSLPLKVRRFFWGSLSKIWFNALYLDPQLVELSRTDLETIETYLSNVQLMVDCKKSAITVSRETWTAIEDRILKWD